MEASTCISFKDKEAAGKAHVMLFHAMNETCSAQLSPRSTHICNPGCDEPAFGVCDLVGFHSEKEKGENAA